MDQEIVWIRALQNLPQAYPFTAWRYYRIGRHNAHTGAAHILYATCVCVCIKNAIA